MADADRALVSLVIASRIGGGALLDCIESFVRAADERLEIIVAECAGSDTPAAIAARFPAVHVRHFDERRSIPELRAAGLLIARGDIVALTTGTCRADSDWLRALRRAHGGPAVAIGGAIEYGGGDRSIDRAVFLCEYGRYMRPFTRHASIDLPGQNVSYKREALEAFADLVHAASWEPLWHRRLRSRGFELVRDPTPLVRLRRHFTLRGFLAERYHYSRAFAGQRLAGRSWLRRAVFAAGTPLLPPLLLARFAGQMLAARGHRLDWLFAMPYIVLFTIPWAAGECVGAAVGPGSSAGRVD